MDLDGYISQGDEIEEIHSNTLEDLKVAEQKLQDYRELIGKYFDKDLDRAEESSNSKYRTLIGGLLNNEKYDLEKDLKETGIEVGRYEIILDSRVNQLYNIYDSLPKEGFIWFEDDDCYSTDEVREFLEEDIERIDEQAEEIHRQIRIVEETDKIPYNPNSERILVDRTTKRPEDVLEEPDWPREYFQPHI